jgi:hypothetical protein
MLSAGGTPRRVGLASERVLVLVRSLAPRVAVPGTVTLPDCGEIVRQARTELAILARRTARAQNRAASKMKPLTTELRPTNPSIGEET